MKADLNRYLPMLTANPLFEGISECKLAAMLETMDARVVDYERGQTFHRPGEALSRSCVLLDGAMVAEDIDFDGDRNILLRLYPGDELDVFLTLSGKLKAPMHVYAVAPSRVLLFDIMNLLSVPGDEDTWRFQRNLLKALSHRYVDVFEKLRIFNKKRIRSRVRVYLTTLEAHDGEVVIPMNRTDLADWLGVDRAALARELGHMQDDGLIRVNKRRIRLLNRDYFQLDTPVDEN